MEVDNIIKQFGIASFSSLMSDICGEHTGFRIPNYQRNYSWKKENINRMLQDCFNGLNNLVANRSSYEDNESSAFTFLGTLILTKENPSSSVDSDHLVNLGHSLSIIDGQQRLTTLVMICCAIVKKIHDLKPYVEKLDKKTDVDWLKNEISFQLEKLMHCIRIQKQERNYDIEGRHYYIPRIVRVDNIEDKSDFRPNNANSHIYNSFVGNFLYQFIQYYSKPSSNNEIVRENENNSFTEKYNHIEKEINNFINQENISEIDYSIISRENFKKREIKQLLESKNMPDKFSSSVSDSKKSEWVDIAKFLRLLYLSSYIRKYTIINYVVTKNDNTGFDIFDALNTAGEPLTPLETLKPQVIKFAETKGSETRGGLGIAYKESDLDKQFQRIEENLPYQDNADKKQKETKKVIVAFFHYFKGKSIPESLREQRNELRQDFNIFGGQGKQAQESKEKFIAAIADVAEFINHHWKKENIENLNLIYKKINNKNLKAIKLFCQFISSMDMPLTIPIMVSYWVKWKKQNFDPEAKEGKEFLHILEILTAYIVLRRTLTRTTDGIDSELRKIMNNEHKSLCLVIEDGKAKYTLNNNNVMSEKIKKEIIKLINQKFNILNDKNLTREQWVQSIYNYRSQSNLPQALAKFLLLAAADNSKIDNQRKNIGLLEVPKKEDEVLTDPQKRYLTFEDLVRDDFATIEHITPQTPPPSEEMSDEEKDIYLNYNTNLTLGNLTLLPKGINSSASNANWDKKKKIYVILCSGSIDERKSLIKEIKDNELSKITKKGEKLLESTNVLNILEPIKNFVENGGTWSKDFIDKRTKNIANLVYIKVSPWLFDKDE